MTIKHHLDQFYTENGIPENGGAEKDTFDIKIGPLTIPLPNPVFRKKVVHIHDIEHVINQKDTSWKGEAFIGGWEIGTGMWKHFPVCLYSLSIFGLTFWRYPKEVISGYKKGLSNKGVIDLAYTRKEFLDFEYFDLKEIIEYAPPASMNIKQWILFFTWISLGQLVNLIPFIILFLLTYFTYKYI